MYVTSSDDNSVKVCEGDETGVQGGDNLSILVQDDQLRWPHTLAEGPDGAIYVTTSHIMDMSWYEPENGLQLTTELWRIGDGNLPGPPDTGAGSMSDGP